MPYIKQEDRERFNPALNSLLTPKTKGELEYCIFKIMKHYMTDKEWKYSNLHDTVYAVQHCADEFRRLYLDSREDVAREQNGDIV